LSIRIGANIPSLGAQRRLSDTTSSLERTYERLSSGMRINRASDDAAGLAVATSLNADSRLYSTASRNISDGLSLLNIADSALGSQTGIVTRLLELAEQSANGTYSTTQRASLQNEYRALQKEFARIADSTIFNGLKLLRGDRSDGLRELTLQAGITGASNSLLSVRTGDTSFLSGHFNLSTIRSGTYGSNVDGELDAADFDAIISAVSGGDPSSVFSGVFYTTVAGSDGRSYEIAIAAFDYSDDGSFGSSYTNSGQVAVSFALFFKNQNGQWDYATVSDGGVFGSGNDFTVTFDESTGRVIGTSSNSGTSYNVGLTMDGASADLDLDFSGLTFSVNQDQSTQTALDFTGVETAQRSRDSLTILRNRLDSLNTLRGTFGAMMSRLGVALNQVFSARENTIAAESRIKDADIADESAELVRKQILQNIGASVLAQANNQPQIALGLLRNTGRRN